MIDPVNFVNFSASFNNFQLAIMLQFVQSLLEINIGVEVFHGGYLEEEQDPFYMLTSTVMELRQHLLTAVSTAPSHFLLVIHEMLV